MKIAVYTALAASLFLGGCTAKKDLAAEQAYRQECVDQLAAANARVAELEANEARDKARLDAYAALAQKFRDAFGTQDLRIVVRNGRLVVMLPNEILFASGSSALTEAGKETILLAANVLTTAERNFTIAGHTDNVPVKEKSSAYRNNWELSTQRALSVVDSLQTNGVAPDRMAAAGYGSYQPVQDNATDDGKKANRRIEIILMPLISELPAFPESI